MHVIFQTLLTNEWCIGLLSSIISACGCESMLELLVGEQSTGYTHSSPYLPLDNSHVVSSNDSPGDNSQALLPTVDLESRLTAITNEGERVQNEEEKAATGIETTTANKSRLLTAVSKEHQGEEKNATGTTGDQDTTSVVEVRVGECNSTRLQPSVHPLDWPEATTLSTDTSHQQQKLLETDRSVDTLAKNQHSLPVELCTTKVVFRSGLLKYILSELRTKLVKDTWKTHPAAKHALLLCLKHLKVGRY